MTLDPVRESLLADAHAAAERVRSQAAADARKRVAQARRRAGELVATARRRGAAEGRLEAAVEEANARVRARGQVLAARREAYDELRRAAHDAVLRLREEPDYDDLLERLVQAARRDLGPACEVELDPPGAGGVRASAGTRRINLTLAALADRCIGDLGPAVRRLWS